MGWELPGHVPHEATRSLILCHVELWEEPTIRYLTRCVSTLERSMDRLEEDSFAQFKHLHLYVK